MACFLKVEIFRKGHYQIHIISAYIQIFKKCYFTFLFKPQSLKFSTCIWYLTVNLTNQPHFKCSIAKGPNAYYAKQHRNKRAYKISKHLR